MCDYRCAYRIKQDRSCCAFFGSEIRHRLMQMAGDHVGIAHGYLDRTVAEDRFKGRDIAAGL